ncbi:MAG: urease accessory protein UreD [Magnetococcales bacterium]|nr:urease accessory protein UreD [Magnetococcales bacterium]
MAPVNDWRCEEEEPGGWRASLALRLERSGARTVLRRREHRGPLLVQKALYPEGEAVCHLLLLHPPGGVVGGDALRIHLDLAEGAHLLLTTPGASKWYRCAPGSRSQQRVEIRLGPGAALEWLPQENIFFDGCDSRLEMGVTLASGARFLGLEMHCLGRLASGERFERGRVRFQSRLEGVNGPLWREQGALVGGSEWLEAGPGLDGARVIGTLLAAGEEVEAAWVAACRAIPVPGVGMRVGVTRLPGVLVARVLADESEAARGWLRGVWGVLRPLVLGREAEEPRIWRT